MADTGAKYPNANTDGSTPWLNPDNAYADDGNYAICSGNMVYKDSYWHGFDFSAVPAGATIDGIKLTVEAYNTSGNANIWDYGLSPDGGSNVYNLAANLGPFETTPTVVSVGGATEKWGRTWSVSELSTSNFRVWIQGYATTSQSWYMDYIRVTVYYTEPDTEPTVTTSAVSDKATTSGTGNGKITDTGGQNATRRGFCYKAGSSGDPTISDSVVYDDGDFGTGSFSKSIPGLTAGTQYRVRAYATNSIGTGYGTTVDFTTTFKKIITETILVLPSIQRLTSKIISARLVVTDVITKLVTFTKTLTEIVISSDIYQKIINLQRTFTEIVIINATFSKIQNLTRTLSESLIIKDARERVLTAYKTLIENVKASDLYEKSASLFKLLSEALTASDLSVTIQKQFLSTFTEVVQAVDKISFTTTRIFQEAINIAGSIIKSGGKTFSEIVIKISELVTTLSAFRVLEERIIVLGTNIKQAGRSFFETIKIIEESIETLKNRVLTEVINVGNAMYYGISRFFTETILVNAQKLTNRAFSFTQSLIAGSIFAKLTTKVFLHRVKGGDQPEFNKIQYTVLTDALNVVSGFMRSMSRNFFEGINIVSLFITPIRKVLLETIGVAENFVALFGHVLYEVVIVTGSLASWSIGKLISQTLKVIDSVGKASAWSMSEVLKVADNLVVIANKILIEIVSVGMSIRFAMGRVITHIIRVGNIRVFRHIFYTIKTESLKVLGAIVHGTSRTFNEIVIAIDTIGSWSIAKLFIEPIKVVASFLRTWTLSRVFTEVIKGGSKAYQQSIKIFKETINVISSTVIPVPAKVFYETLKVVQNITKSLPKTFEEVLSVTGNMLNQTGKTFVEAINVVGTFVLGTISKLFIEVVKVAHSLTNVGTFYKLFSEAISATEQFANRTGKIFTETIEVVGQFVLGTISKLFIETIKTIETYVRAWTLSRVFTETISVVEAYYNQAGKIFTEVVNVVGAMANFAIGKLFLEVTTISQSITKLTSRTFTQAINVVSSFVKFTYGRIFGEIINVGEAITRSMGRLFTEHIGIDWGKIKLVLNGIQVGLWKKVARITNGVWRKISRNDTL